MGRHAKDNGGGDFQQAPAGTHLARCVRLTDIGTHHSEYQGKPVTRNQVIVMWELPNETFEVDGQQKPFIVSKFYTNSLSEKANLRKDLESWRGQPFEVKELLGFDLMNVLGKPCILSIVHNEDGKAKVASVAKVMKGMECPQAVNTPDAFWIDEWNQEKFDSFSDGIKKLITESDECRNGIPPVNNSARDTVDKLDEDIPF